MEGSEAVLGGGRWVTGRREAERGQGTVLIVDMVLVMTLAEIWSWGCQTDFSFVF